MHSDLIGKIEKARRYAEEPDRISLGEIKASFRGGSTDHEIVLQDGEWQCNCSFFHNWGTCAHVMAMQKVLSPMLDAKSLQIGGPLDNAEIAESLA